MKGTCIRLCMALAVVLLLSALSGCGKKPDQNEQAGPVEITVVTPFSESDGNRTNFVAAYQDYEVASGNTVVDIMTFGINEDWKANVISNFLNGKDPDVIFYFTGADADELIQNNKLVSISDIRKEYPDYASNMKESLMPVSTYDGRQYAVSVYGYWEGLFVNKKVLEDCGIALPGAGYTWEQFLADCRIIRSKGYTPIACALADVPHYWFEYCVFNNGSVASHTKLPTGDDTGDDIRANLEAGLADIKELYAEGFFPENTAGATDDETVMLMAENKAAFLLDGSWKVGWFEEHVPDINDFVVTYVPAKGVRKSTDAIGGFSMGYSISKKAWDDPQKREACVQFITAMTTDEVVSTFGALTVTSLKNGVIASGELDELSLSALAMTKGCTAMVPAVQDLLNPMAREALFMDIIHIAAGDITPEQAVDACLALMQ